MSASAHPLDEAIALQSVGEGAFAGRSSRACRNMVGPCGGVTVARLLQAMLLRPERFGDPVSPTVNFAGPVVAGPFRFGTRPMRSNRSTQRWTASDPVGVTAARGRDAGGARLRAQARA